MRKMKVPPQIVRLSLEEQAILQDDQNVMITALDSDTHEIDRLIDTGVGLDQTTTIVNETPEFNSVDQALVSCVSDAIVAGTDADPEELAESMLSEKGVSAESFASTVLDGLKKMWEAIKAWLQKAWASIKKFFASLAAFFSPNKRKEEEAKKKQEEEEALKKASDEEKRQLAKKYAKERAARDAHFEAGFFIFKGCVNHLSMFGRSNGDKILPPQKILQGARELTTYYAKAIKSITTHSFEQAKLVLATVEAIGSDATNLAEHVEKMAKPYLDIEQRMYSELELQGEGSVSPNLMGNIRLRVEKSTKTNVYGLNELRLTNSTFDSFSSDRECRAVAFSLDQGKEMLDINAHWRMAMEEPVLKHDIERLQNISDQLERAYEKMLTAYVRPTMDVRYTKTMSEVRTDDLKGDDGRIKCQRALSQLIYSLAWRVRINVLGPMRDVSNIMQTAMIYEVLSGGHRVRMALQGYDNVYKPS